MVLDAELLKRAQAVAAILAETERQALLARGEYHAAIRRLHLGGGSLREIASALGLSHQRVQQIVDDAGGSWWRRAWRTRNPERGAVCTFCGRPPSEVAKLIAGPGIYICEACVAAAERALGPVAAASGPFTPGVASTRARCAFCGKRRQPLATSARAHACAGCLRTCREILEQRGG